MSLLFRNRCLFTATADPGDGGGAGASPPPAAPSADPGGEGGDPKPEPAKPAKPAAKKKAPEPASSPPPPAADPAPAADPVAELNTRLAALEALAATQATTLKQQRTAHLAGLLSDLTPTGLRLAKSELADVDPYTQTGQAKIDEWKKANADAIKPPAGAAPPAPTGKGNASKLAALLGRRQ